MLFFLDEFGGRGLIYIHHFSAIDVDDTIPLNLVQWKISPQPTNLHGRCRLLTPPGLLAYIRRIR